MSGSIVHCHAGRKQDTIDFAHVEAVEIIKYVKEKSKRQEREETKTPQKKEST